MKVRIVTGPGGAGKTHLLAELTAQLAADGWYTGFLRDELPQASLDWLGTVVAPVAIAVDYAEAAREADILRLARAVRDKPGGPARLLLGARALSAWWSEDVRPALRDDGLPAPANPAVELPVRHPSPARVFRRAQTAFATAARRTNPSTPLPPPPTHGSWTTLDLVMLAWLDVHADGGLPTSRPALYDEILTHELGYWTRAFRRRFGERVPATSVLRAAGASVTLLAPTAARLGAALEQVAALDQAGQQRSEIHKIIGRMLPVDPADGSLAIRPDPVGDHLAVSVFRADQAALVRHLTHADEQERLRACVTLSRAADDTTPDAVQDLADAAVAQVDGLWRPALTVATAQGGPFLPALVRLAQSPATPLPLADLARDLPLGHATLRPLALAAALHVNNEGAGATTADEQSAAARAQALGIYAIRLADAGRRLEALHTAQKAADLYRQLADANPAAFLPNLAGSLNTLAAFLSNAGQRPEALHTAQESANLRRQLADANPAAFLPDLAISLNNLAIFLADAGQRPEALHTAQESA